MVPGSDCSSAIITLAGQVRLTYLHDRFDRTSVGAPLWTGGFETKRPLRW